MLGTLADVQNLLATDADSALIRLIGSVIGQEGASLQPPHTIISHLPCTNQHIPGEQDGYFRAVTDRVPSSLPFLTGCAGPLAYSAIMQDFVVPGTCPNANTISIPIFAPLAILTPGGGRGVLQPRTQYVEFSFAPTAAMGSDLNLVYINHRTCPSWRSCRTRLRPTA